MPTTSRSSHLASIPTPVPSFYWRVESKKSNCICSRSQIKNPHNTRLFRPPRSPCPACSLPAVPAAPTHHSPTASSERPTPARASPGQGHPTPAVGSAEGISHPWLVASSKPAGSFFYRPGSPKLSPFLSDLWRSNWPLFPPSLGADPPFRETLTPEPVNPPSWKQMDALWASDAVELRSPLPLEKQQEGTDLGIPGKSHHGGMHSGSTYDHGIPEALSASAEHCKRSGPLWVVC